MEGKRPLNPMVVHPIRKPGAKCFFQIKIGLVNQRLILRNLD
jgi:hypothetical protein